MATEILGRGFLEHNFSHASLCNRDGVTGLGFISVEESGMGFGLKVVMSEVSSFGVALNQQAELRGSETFVHILIVER